MQHADIVNEMQALGMGEDEAAVYLRLLQVGPSKVSQLADYVDMSRSSLYRVLDGLVEEGFVSKSLDRPTVYSPEDPETIFEIGSQQLERKLDRLNRVQDRVLDPLRELAGDQGLEEDPHHWKRLEGASRIYEIISKRAQEAEERIEVVSNHALCERTDIAAVESAWQELAAQGSQGVTVHLLLGFDDPAASVPDSVVDACEQLRRFEEDRTLHFLLFDREELVLVLRPKNRVTETDEEMAVWTNAPGLLATHALLVDRLWPDADPLLA